MFWGFILSIPMVIAGRVPAAPVWIGFGLPVLVTLLSFYGIWTLRKPVGAEASEEDAVRVMRRGWQTCAVVAASGGLWCIGSWWNAAPDVRIYYVVIMAVGALTMGYCLTAVRAIGLSALLLMLLPIAALLFSTGQLMDSMVAIALLIAIGFQVVMMRRHQQLLLELVEERWRSRELARRDALTGLHNRRALLEDAAKMGKAGQGLRLMLVDIDRFKSVNDRYGHNTGDDVLVAVARLLADHARGNVRAARIGGEEFALLGPSAALDPATALQLLSEIRAADMPHGEELTASIGVADGTIQSAGDWTALYGRADRALYAAKNEGRNRVVGNRANEDDSSEPVSADAHHARKIA